MSIAELFAPLLPPGTAFATLPTESAPRLFPDEEAAVARAVVKRQRTFAAGRACARRALGVEVAIGVGTHGAPQWPAGFVGSITHTDDDAAAVASQALRAIGIDLESLAHAARVADLIATVATPRDVLPAHADVAALVFSAKESIYKCLYPLTGRLLDFSDVDVAFGDGTFSVLRAAGYADVAAVRGRFASNATHVATVAFIPK